jgi:hypothetical protein
MSLFDTLKNVAGEFLGATNTANATNPTAFADHIAQNADSLDESTLLHLGQQLLTTFTTHSAYAGDGAQAAEDAGTTAEAVASGEPNAIAAFMTFAKDHPEVLQSLAHAFTKQQQAD